MFSTITASTEPEYVWVEFYFSFLVKPPMGRIEHIQNSGKLKHGRKGVMCLLIAVFEFLNKKKYLSTSTDIKPASKISTSLPHNPSNTGFPMALAKWYAILHDLLQPLPLH